MKKMIRSVFENSSHWEIQTFLFNIRIFNFATRKIAFYRDTKRRTKTENVTPSMNVSALKS